jgi:lysine biosynthesis protein LysW
MLKGAAMSFRVRCPQCGHSIETAESALGKVLHCPGCGHDIAVAARDPARQAGRCGDSGRSR